MIPSPQSLATVSGTALAALAAGYTTLAGIALRRPANPGRLLARQPRREPMPAVTILKPLCGAEHGLYERLRSFCEQRYPDFQIVFGVRDLGDPALTAVRQLQRDFPGLDLEVAANPSQHGTNAKVSNLINMMPHARHDYLVIADSDVQVPRDYLERVIAPLADEGVGIVTCPYRGAPRPGLWSLLGSMFVNEWFMPSVRVAALLGSREFASGATIALRRESLERIGGFAALANRLADDYALGELTRQRGLTTVLSGLEVETSVDEAGAGGLLRHELRWLRGASHDRFCAAPVLFPMDATMGDTASRSARVRAMVLELRDARGRVAAHALSRGARWYRPAAALTATPVP
ncbi:MAG: glycosyltransferase [Gammaproteobacteria bacterium]|nr:MAG: glycosyltransferase [Gammaproteobacteria bacterium]